MGRGETLTTKLFMNILNIAHFTHDTCTQTPLHYNIQSQHMCTYVIHNIYKEWRAFLDYVYAVTFQNTVFFRTRSKRPVQTLSVRWAAR